MLLPQRCSGALDEVVHLNANLFLLFREVDFRSSSQMPNRVTVAAALAKVGRYDVAAVFAILAGAFERSFQSAKTSSATGRFRNLHSSAFSIDELFIAPFAFRKRDRYFRLELPCSL